MRSIAIIPARLASTRLPRKILRPICGRPMLAHVYEAARASRTLDQVIVATDAAEIFDYCRTQGWPVEMTSAEHTSGTGRVHEVAQKYSADVYVNVQGDEPLARPGHLDSLLALMQRSEVEVGTLMTPCAAFDVNNPNAVKVVCEPSGRALYFSRSAIPFNRDGRTDVAYFKHLGFYAYRKAALDRFMGLPESGLERAERLEQLRFLENGTSIYAAETPHDTIGVDTEEDLQRVETLLKNRL